MGVATWLRNSVRGFSIMKSEDENIYIYIYTCREKRQSRRISHASSRDQHGRIYACVCIVDKEREKVEKRKDRMMEERMEEERNRESPSRVI